MPVPRAVLATLAALFLFGIGLAPAKAGQHPRLPSASANCSTCHGELTEGKRFVHGAVEDCSGCHEVELASEGTTIRLAATEPDLCLTCHGELEKAAKGELAAPHAPVSDACTTCHAPHAGDWPQLLKAREAELCGECHDAADLAPKHGNLLTASTACTACHDAHGSGVEKALLGAVQHAPFDDGSCVACHRPNFGERIRLMARGQRLCLACHDDPAAAGESGSVHPALRDDGRGRAGCLACHDPHLSAHAGVVEKGGVALCAGCHEAVATAAKAKTGHAPAADDCGSCHLPHAGPQPRLLNASGTELCGTCHDAGDADLEAKHLGADLAATDCLACHSPHGDGQPRLLAKYVHAPVLDGCDSCHEGAFDALAEGGGAELCAQCHSEIPEAAAQAAVPHAAMEMGSCTPCHDPHAAPRARLVKAPAAGCGECHADQVAGAGEVPHGVIDLLGCEACHEPHGGSKAKLLRAEGAELCLSCHADGVVKAATDGALRVFDRFALPTAGLSVVVGSPAAVDNHPVTGHRALGQPTPEELKRTASTHTGPLTCTTCHDPHKGRSGGLLNWGAASPTAACQHCHTK